MKTYRITLTNKMNALGHLRSALVCAAFLGACGGTGNEADSGPNKTYLRVEAVDADGDALHYEWRVTAGSIENRDAAETVWTMPDGPGLHFAYVTVSDGRGGYAEQQYAAGTDALGTTAPARQPVNYIAPALTDFDGAAARLRFVSAFKTTFTPPGGGTSADRQVYLPDVAVRVVHVASGVTVFSGLSDLNGDVSLPKLRNAEGYKVLCSTTPDSTLTGCPGETTSGLTSSAVAQLRQRTPNLTAARNLRVFGHVGLADGGVCGTLSETFARQSAATVQLLQADGVALTAPVRVNLFGDYALDAAALVNGSVKLMVQCETYQKLLDVPADAAGYSSDRPIEVSHQIPNNRPRLVKVVANGTDGNVRGRMLIPEPGAASNGLPGEQQFLTYKGSDTRLSACMYYRAIGAARDCDAQGHMLDPITLDDWKRRHRFKPYGGTNIEWAANYINRMDLNLVRRMSATQTDPQTIAFYVCNHPGPDGTSQAEIDEVIDFGQRNERLVACVAMEWSVSPGVNGGQPFTKFLTFGPDGSLVPSVNLDRRGEKFMPGACVACHGGTQYNGRFAEKGEPSPFLGSSFLPFDTGNYAFSSSAALSEDAQDSAFYELNQLVAATEGAATSTPVTTLIAEWYRTTGKKLDKSYVPTVWDTDDGARKFYREVVGSACRTCHVAVAQPTSNRFDWDKQLLNPGEPFATHVCGGTPDIASNASMPNALVARDRVLQRVQADPALTALMNRFLGCVAPLPDPVYPKR